MNDRTEAPRPSGADDAAAVWFARLRAGDQRDQAPFETWYAADPAHAAAYDRLLTSWERSSAAAALGHLRQRPRNGGAPWWALVAACLLAIIGVSWFTLARHRPGDQAVLAALIETPPDKLHRLVLADGSRILLDADSALDTRTFASRGQVRLVRGRARFQVSQRSARTFSVATTAGSVRAAGTVFDLAIAGTTTRIAMIAGHAAVLCAERPDQTYVIGAGQALTVAPTGPRSAAGPVDRDTLGWVEGIRAFENERVGDVVAALNRGGAGTIAIDDPRIGELRFTGTLRPGEIAATARLLAQTFQLRLRKDAAGVLHLSAPQGRWKKIPG